jgi:hypothetical protein
MGDFMINTNENRVKCGKCNTEFDLNKNDGCPLCGFGVGKQTTSTRLNKKLQIENEPIKYLAIPNNLELEPGELTIDDEIKSVGSWGMFNSFFPGKAVLRILANMLDKEKTKTVTLDALTKKTSETVEIYNLSKLRGFPKDPDNNNSIGRLVYHFIRTFTEMGFFTVKPKEETKKNVWDEPWNNIEITLTKEGLEFAKIRNKIFDNSDFSQTSMEFQILTKEEKQWLTDYLKKIDEEGYKEYSILKNVFEFIKQGHNGKGELWNWFETNPAFVDYVKQWSRKTENPEDFGKQIKNLSTTFAAGKLALLRELGIISNKRNDYTIVGEI